MNVECFRRFLCNQRIWKHKGNLMWNTILCLHKKKFARFLQSLQITKYYCISTKYLFFVLDTNECIVGTHDCNQTCINTVGGFICACRPGYLLLLDGKSCVQIDECLAGTSNCTDGQQCVDTDGSFFCRSMYDNFFSCRWF